MTTLHVVNASTTGISEYQDLPLRGLVEHNGALYGITPTAFVEFTGSSDQGSSISAHIKTGKMKFGSNLLKRFLRIYAGGSASQGLEVAVTTEELGVEQTRDYTIASWTGDLRARFERLARGVKSRFVQIKIANGADGTFQLEQAELLVERTVRGVADGG